MIRCCSAKPRSCFLKMCSSSWILAGAKPRTTASVKYPLTATLIVGSNLASLTSSPPTAAISYSGETFDLLPGARLCGSTRTTGNRARDPLPAAAANAKWDCLSSAFGGVAGVNGQHNANRLALVQKIVQIVDLRFSHGL